MFDAFPHPRGGYPLGQVGTVGGWAISSYFGARPNPFTSRPSFHGGQDIVMPRYTPTYSVLPGYIAQGWDSSGGGNWSTLHADNGWRIGNGHLVRFAPGVIGTWQPAGTLIGWADSTGSSTGDHDHFALAFSRYGPWQDPFDDLEATAAAGRFVGATVRPTVPLPDPESIPEKHEPIDPRKALITLQYWTIKNEPTIYRVDVDPFLSDKAVVRDPAHAGMFVGGEYAFHFPNPATFALDAGLGVSAVELDPGNGFHAEMITELRGLPRIAQAA